MDAVFVSGCFDSLHSGQIYFLQQAATYGPLIVAVGSDETVHGLKGEYPLCPEEERLYAVQSLGCVHEAFISSGEGYLDFREELIARKPKLFIVRRDGDRPEKRTLCETLGIRYEVMDWPRAKPGMPERSATAARKMIGMPYRLDLAGGWIDQPALSRVCPGSVLVASLQPRRDYFPSGGLATSTRARAEKLWGDQLPSTDDKHQLARMLFAYENQPGSPRLSGSQDAIGICVPGVCQLAYAGHPWPEQIHRITPVGVVAEWLERFLFMKWIGDRPQGYSPNPEEAAKRAGYKRIGELGYAATLAAKALGRQDLEEFGLAVRQSFHTQCQIFPEMVTPQVQAAINALPSGVLGHKLAGAGAGGYLVVVAENRPLGFERVRLRY